MIEFNSSISALETYGIRQDVSANDVANINTPGYEESSIIQTEQSNYQGPEVSAIRATINYSDRFSNTRLEVEMPKQMINETGYQANASVIKTQDQMLGEVIDLIS